MAKIFISHKKEDSAVAAKVAERLRFNGIGYYLDVVDNIEVKDGPELSDYIRVRMSECTQLMAIISPVTKESWWVPWEIGVATEKDYPIASFISQNLPSVPSYLKKWPFLRTDNDIDAYAQETKTFEGQRQHVRLAEGLERLKATAPRSVADFHRQLKKRLGQ